MAGITALTVTFLGLLAYGLTTWVMHLFTGMSSTLRVTQLTVLALEVIALTGVVGVTAQRGRTTARVLGSALAVSMAGLAITACAMMWRVLPI